MYISCLQVTCTNQSCCVGEITATITKLYIHVLKRNVEISHIHNRLAYGVWMLQEILEKYSSHGSEIFVMYDIACTLFSHLQVMSLCLSVYICSFNLTFGIFVYTFSH